MSESDYYELMDQIESLEDCPTKVSLLEQAVRIADSLNDKDLSYDTRSELIRSATFSGMPDKALPAFTWCLAQIDKNPDDYDDDDMLWEYKWILPALRQFPAITLKQIVDLEDDLQKRLTKAGYSLRPFYDARFERLQYPENAAEKANFFELWKKSKRDHLADCRACEESSIAHYYFATEQPDKGLKKGFEILDKDIRCASVPHGLLATMLVPLVVAGRTEEARTLQSRGYRMISRSQMFLSDISDHIEYFLYTGDLTSALRIVVRHLPWALNTREWLDKLDFLLQAGLVLQKTGSKKRKLKLPAEFPLYNPEGSYISSELAIWFNNEADSLARLFDQRNQNQHLQNWVKKTRSEILAMP